MPNFKDPRAAADRLRTATQSLSAPEDQEVVRRYLHDLELAAAQQDAEDARTMTPKASFGSFARAAGDMVTEA